MTHPGIKVHGVLCCQGIGLGANRKFQLPRDQIKQLHSRMLMRPRLVRRCGLEFCIESIELALRGLEV
jgi:hypothetical protein